MSLIQILNESLTLHPLIQENHFPKAALALERLSSRFSTIDEKYAGDVWGRLDLGAYPKTEVPICQNVIVPTLFPERERRMLARALFPSVYGIVYKKVEAVGAKVFLKSYLRQAIEDPEYLGHRFTVLVSFYELWPKVENDSILKLLWIDRLTEFLMTAFTAAPSEYSLRKIESTGALTFAEVLKAALPKPGFFGHHLIVLATVKRFENDLLKNETQDLLAKILAMTTLDYKDGEDFVVINKPQTLLQVTDIDLEKTVINYLKQGPDDPHLLSFADSLCILWDLADLADKNFIMSNFTRFMNR